MKLDSNQQNIAFKLDELAQKLEKKGNNRDLNQKKSFCLRVLDCFFSKFFDFVSKNQEKNNKNIVFELSLGFYIYGEVGRGKTMLMRRFFEKAKQKNKLYLHFNSFMISLHQELHLIRKNHSGLESEELIIAIKRIIKSAEIICFDEFQVADVADAMLLARIFSYFFDNNICLVITSNSHPLELYKNGIQRDIFLKFVREILLKNLEILHLNSTSDYRFLLSSFKNRYFLNNEKGCFDFENLKKRIISKSESSFKPTKKIIEVFGRKIEIEKTFKNIAEINAHWLFESEFFYADFKAICQNFEVIFLVDLFAFDEIKINEAKRFTVFIDETYEQKIDLVILAEVSASELYPQKFNEKFKFMERAISRIAELTAKN